MFAGFTNPCSFPPKTGLPALSMLLFFDTVSRTASKPQGAWQGNEKGISRGKVDALKNDLRTASQEKGHKRCIANCFQKAELKAVSFFVESTISESLCSFLGVIFFKKSALFHF